MLESVEEVLDLEVEGERVEELLVTKLLVLESVEVLDLEVPEDERVDELVEELLILVDEVVGVPSKTNVRNLQY